MAPILSYISQDVVSLFILLLLYRNLHRQKRLFLMDQKLFVFTIAVNAFTTIFDLLMWLFDGVTFPGSTTVMMTICVFYFIGNALPCLGWALYVDYQVFRDERGLFRRLPFYLIPAILNTVLALSCYFIPSVFYLDAQNHYFRGSWMPLQMFFSYIYVAIALVVMIVNRKHLQKGTFITMCLFLLPPIIGSVLQMMFYGVSLIWICISLSLLIVFINMQNNYLVIDTLTGVFNRRQLENFLRSKLLQKQRRNDRAPLLAGLMLDIDRFKSINDMYGHIVGDEALENAAHILQKSVRKQDFIARYGGDEFIILMDVSGQTEVQDAIFRIKTELASFNATARQPYRLDFSIGHCLYDYQNEISMEDFIRQIDARMYEDKERLPIV